MMRRDLLFARGHTARLDGIQAARSHPVTRVGFGVGFSYLAGAVVALASARLLGPEGFGIYAIATSLAIGLAQVLDLGSSIVLVRLVSQSNSVSDSASITHALATAKGIQLLGGLALAGCVFWAATALHLSTTLRIGGPLVLVTACILSCWQTIRATCQANGKFTRYAVLMAVYGLLECLLLGAMWLTNTISPLGLFGASYALPVGLLVIVEGTFLLRARRAQIDTDLRVGLAMLRRAVVYGRWVTLSVVAYGLIVHVQRVVFASRVSATEVGQLAAATTVASALALINESFRLVYLPRVTKLKDHEIALWLRKWRSAMPAALIVIAAAMGTLGFAMKVVLGDAYVAAIPVFLVLSASMGMTIYIGFANMLVHRFGIPRAEAYVNVGRVGLVCIATWLLGASGAIAAAIGCGCILVGGEFVLYRICQRRVRLLEAFK